MKKLTRRIPMLLTATLILTLLSLFASAGALAEYGAVIRRDANMYLDSGMRTPIGQLPKHTAVVVKAVKSGKAMLFFRNSIVYVYKKDLWRPWEAYVNRVVVREGGNLEDTNRYVTKTCYIYDYPSTGAFKLRKVKKGTMLSGFKEFGGWSIVMDRNNTYYGYVKTSNLEGVSGGDGTHYPLN